MKYLQALLLILSMNLFSMEYDPDLDRLEDFEFRGFLRNSFEYAYGMEDTFAAEASIGFVVEGILMYDSLHENLSTHNRKILEKMSSRYSFCSN